MKNDGSMIAGACGINGAAVLAASEAIEGLTGKPPRLERQADLAGPNDNFQILLDVVTYAAISECVRPFLNAVLGEAAKDAWQAIKSLWKKQPPETNDAETVERIRQLQRAVAQAQQAGNTAIIGMRFDYRSRNAGIELTSAQITEFTVAAKLMAEYVEELLFRVESERRRLLDEGATVSFVENSDCSLAVKATDTMVYVEMVVRWEVGREERITIHVPIS
ncbi:hypothetical protein [Rhizobium leguminosarum]|uniref:hypothetical protein n=1 Tax=Rhizobium leguminosarum TaxID=384 RepID=UPI001C9101E0|nr:hypothetical protein [Rhizobium leguminosarum]MBY3041739.1 hypothetical protein [Rhizobium leguminosarum]